MNISSAHIAAISAFSLWGLFPIFWKLFDELSAWDLFAHRILWSFLSLLFIIFLQKKMGELKNIWIDKKIRYRLMLSGILISSNWLLYIYAISVDKILEASMGYFLNPIINVLFGRIILNEYLRKTQWPAIILAMIAIFFMALQNKVHDFPWIAITLALTFAFYGIIRKTTPVGSLEGLAFETFFIIGPVIFYWLMQETSPKIFFEKMVLWKQFALSLSGLVTCIPLVLFSFAAKRLKLQTLGFIQYLSPSLKFICGLLIFNEPLSSDKLCSFILIWIALAWYTLESVLYLKKIR
jgi:chloramphenicol-sensitive protein RarD